MQENKYRSSSPPDDTPIAQWYQLHALPLLAYVRQHVPSREDAEDIVVEAFIAALEQKGFSPYTLSEQEQIEAERFPELIYRHVKLSGVPLYQNMFLTQAT